MDRDTELLKIQVYADYCHTTFTFRSSVTASAYIGLPIAILVLAYQGIILWYVYSSTAAATMILFYINLTSVFKGYHNSLDQIQALINQVNRNETLPTLKEMRKTIGKGK